jgi:hypothetical protein
MHKNNENEVVEAQRDVFQVFKNRVIAEGSWNESEDANNIWKEMATHIRKVVIEVFGVTRGNKRELKNT